jgi:hypothetical protein
MSDPELRPPKSDPRIELSEIVAIPLGVVLVVMSLASAWHGISLLESGQIHKGIKSFGFSMMILGASFDPINFIWLCFPFTARLAVRSPRYEHLSLPFCLLGISLYILGLLADHVPN